MKTSPKKSGPVVHFEMPAKDEKRIAKFYTNAFGWQTHMINGGFYPKDDKMQEQHPSVVISVSDIKKSIDKVIKAGGKLIGEPMEIHGFGMYVSFSDTEGNRVSMMEPTMEMKAKAI